MGQYKNEELSLYFVSSFSQMIQLTWLPLLKAIMNGGQDDFIDAMKNMVGCIDAGYGADL